MKKFINIQTTTAVLSSLVLVCFALSQMAQAAPDVNPPPDGGYPRGNTAEGSSALFSLTTGYYNNAFGFDALFSNTTGNRNVGIGLGALGQNTTGNDNIALGYLSGSDLTTGDNNIYIGNLGVANESNTIRIGDPAIHQTVIIGGIPAGGLAAILFDYNSGGITIGAGGSVPFNQTALQVGTAITQTNSTTFTLNQDGGYRVT